MLSLSAATRGCISQSLFGRALSSPETPHQVLKQKPKTTQNIDNDDDILEDHLGKLSFHASCGFSHPASIYVGSSCYISHNLHKNKSFSSYSPPTPLGSSCRYSTLLLVLLEFWPFEPFSAQRTNGRFSVIRTRTGPTLVQGHFFGKTNDRTKFH